MSVCFGACRLLCWFFSVPTSEAYEAKCSEVFSESIKLRHRCFILHRLFVVRTLPSAPWMLVAPVPEHERVISQQDDRNYVLGSP